MNAYTDADVKAGAVAAIRAGVSKDGGMSPSDTARAVLDEVAAAIAARAKAEALREYADDLEANNSALSWQWSDFVYDAREYAESYSAVERT